MTVPKNPTERLQLKIVLDHLKPAVWRRVIVNDDLTFLQLHRVIQEAMGWEDGHLHEFSVGTPPMRIGTKPPIDFGGFDDEPLTPEITTRLAKMLEGRKKFRYWYDFGDDWMHTVTIEKRLPPDASAPPAQLVAGEFACPPEDCGGPYGYANLLEALADPAHPEREDYLDWLGGEFDPTEFDLGTHARRVAATVKPRRAKAARSAAG